MHKISRGTIKLSNKGHNMPRELSNIKLNLLGLEGVEDVGSSRFIPSPKTKKRFAKVIGYCDKNRNILFRVKGNIYSQRFLLRVQPEDQEKVISQLPFFCEKFRLNYFEN